MKTVLAFIGTIIGAVIILALLGFGLGWFKAGTDIVSADNVKKQHELVIDKYNSMIAAADNVCTAQGTVEKGERSPTLVENPTTAYEATFRSIVKDYNNAVDNLFKAKIVKPEGYPSSVMLNELDTSDWCTVSDQVRSLKN